MTPQKARLSSNWAIPAALLALVVLSFGTMGDKLGFYWDDWTIMWYVHFLGPSSFQEAYAVDRPLLASVVGLTTSLLGESPLNWQVFGVFTRWLASLALWWTLSGLWPKWKAQTAAIALLFAVYPGFNQQYIAVTYSNGFLLFTIFLVSLGMMIQAIRKPRWFWAFYLPSLALCAYALFTSEYFFGLELLRPVFLWLVLGETMPEPRKRLSRTALYWTPYAALAAAFLAWRLTHPTPRAEVTIFDNLSASPAAALLELGRTMASDLFKATALAWKNTLNISTILGYEPITILKYAVIMLLTAGMSIFLLARLRVAEDASATIDPRVQRRRWGAQAVVVGAFALLAAGLPIWVTNLRIELFFPWDRFTIPMMMGASLLVVGLIETIARNRLQRAILVGVLVGLAAGFHFQSALDYRKEWLSVRDFFWQLAWRAPGLQPGTLVLTSEMPFQYNWDNSLTAPLNWTYAPQLSGRQLPYLIYNVESRLSSGLPALEKDTQITEQHRLTPFSGSPSQAILVTYQPPGCLKVIDPQIDQRLPDKPLYFREVMGFSDPGLILAHADPEARPPEHILGPEPQHDWCYFFEKAELAVQQGDWQEAARLGDQALALGKEFYRKNAAELTPFILGYAHVGRWDEALQLSMEAYRAWENTRLMLCDTWERLYSSSEPSAPREEAYQEMMKTLQCTDQ